MILWRIWHVLTVLAAQHGNPRHRFDPATLRSLKPRTIRSYQIQVGRLVQWLDSEGRKPEDEYDWDDVIGDYLRALAQKKMCRSQTETLVAGVESRS